MIAKMAIKQTLIAYGRNEIDEDEDLEHIFHCVEMVRQVSILFLFLPFSFRKAPTICLC